MFTLFVLRDTQTIQTMLLQILPNILSQLPEGHSSSLRHLPPEVKYVLFFRYHEIVDPVFGDLLNLVSDKLSHINLFFLLLIHISFSFFLDLLNFYTGFIYSLLLGALVFSFHGFGVLLILSYLEDLVSAPSIERVSTLFVVHSQEYGLTYPRSLPHIRVVRFPDFEGVSQYV